MRLRKHEREALTTLLNQEWDDVDDLAKAVFDTACGLLLQRHWHVLIAGGDGWVTVFGPYETVGLARKALPSLEILGNRVIVRRVLTINPDMDGEIDDLS